MAKLVWALLCRRVIIDAPSNILSYIDALDGVNVQKFPAQAPPIAACTVWQRESDAESSLTMRASMISPNGATLFQSPEVSLHLEPVHKRARINSGLIGFEFAEPGRYHVTIELKSGQQWNEVTRIPLDVDQVPVPQAESVDEEARVANPIAARVASKRRAAKT